MLQKRLLAPHRVRKIPAQFSWLDHRLIRQGRLRECDPPAWALYLFLCAVGDERGLSYYSDASLGRELRLDLPTLSQARQQLLRAEVVAYEKPLWQLLALDPPTERTGGIRSVAEVLRAVFAPEGGAQ